MSWNSLPTRTFSLRPFSCAFRYYQRDVVSLFLSTELPKLACDGREQLFWGQLAMLPDGFQQTLFAKFLSRIIKGLGSAVGVQEKGVAW